MEENRLQKDRRIGIWLLIGVFMLIIQVLLGGITRLTGSGLSITEWKPILGIIPPLNDVDWQKAFSMYQEKTGQYKYLNNDFTMSDFKFIYFWEWFHRAWGRIIGIVFLIPFIYFLWKQYFNTNIAIKLIALFLLGMAQGLIGWIMVMSGLNDDNLYVSHIKLAVHFISALVLISFTFWYALTLLINKKYFVSHQGLKNFTLLLIILLGVQLTYGAFMAGLKAATVAPTWPSINGEYFPANLKNFDFLYDKVNIHFIHRNLAYLITLLTLLWYFKAMQVKTSPLFIRLKNYPLYFIIVQVVLGILTVLYSTSTVRNGFGPFEYFAQLHQLVAMFFLMSLISVQFLLAKKN